MCGSGAVMWRIRRGHGSLQRFLHRSVSIGKVCIGTGMQQNCSLWQARVLREMRISKIGRWQGLTGATLSNCWLGL